MSITCVVALLVSPCRAEQREAEAWPLGPFLETMEQTIPALARTPEEALVVADAARRLGRDQAAAELLERAQGSPQLSQVALVELSQLELSRLAQPGIGSDPSRSEGGAPGSVDAAVRRVLPLLRQAATAEIRSAAVEVARQAVGLGLTRQLRDELTRTASRLPRSLSRSLELELTLAELDWPAGQGPGPRHGLVSAGAEAAADRAGAASRRRLQRLLESRTGDLPALTAARALAGLGAMSEKERWLVAQTLFRHALYSEAEPYLEQLAASRSRAAPAWEVAFLRGRCAFRRGRWLEAMDWYRAALAVAQSRDRRASLETHLGRALELAGDLEEAIEAARRAVVIRSSDDRRLFLARLRLRNGQPDLAARGISAIRGRERRDRGRLLLALDDLARERPDEALERLRAISNNRWRGPAGVLAATAAADEGDWLGAAERLYQAGPRLDAFWSGQARRLIASMPEAARSQLRQLAIRELAPAEGRSSSHGLARWSALCGEGDVLESLRHAMQQRLQLAAGPGSGEPSSDGLDRGAESPTRQHRSTPEFPGQVAGGLWRLGLLSSAVRWDPGGFPGSSAADAGWSAARFLELESPTRAMTSADAAWRKAVWPALPRALPDSLQRALYPLPYPDRVRSAAGAAEVPWSLLAGVVREESRWDPGVLSRVGARGLTQLMPATAAGVAESLGEQAPAPEQLFDPETGLRLGAVELGRLLQRFEGLRPAAVAAYNAGEAQAHEWLLQCPEPCTEERYLLTISFDVTRAYTAEVLASAASYDALYEASSGPGSASPAEPPSTLSALSAAAQEPGVASDGR